MPLPPEYLQLLTEMKAQHEKCSAITEHIMNTGIGDPQLYVENEKMSQLSDRLYQLRKRLALNE
jgi:hypothetical protein